jgi:hypothetical protein
MTVVADGDHSRKDIRGTVVGGFDALVWRNGMTDQWIADDRGKQAILDNSEPRVGRCVA